MLGELARNVSTVGCSVGSRSKRAHVWQVGGTWTVMLGRASGGARRLAVTLQSAVSSAANKRQGSQLCRWALLRPATGSERGPRATEGVGALRRWRLEPAPIGLRAPNVACVLAWGAIGAC